MRESGHHGDVMETLASVARGLPSDVLCEDGEGVEVMVGMWVREKRELASRGADSPSLDQWRHRWGGASESETGAQWENLTFVYFMVLKELRA